MLVGRSAGGDARHVAPVDGDPARRRLLETGDLFQERGLAAARRPDQRHELARARRAG
jgi:hypothetical protein